MHNNKAGIIFDLDGLLVDTERPFIDCFARIARERGFSITDELMVSMIGLGVREEERLFKEHFGAYFPYMELREATNIETKIYHKREGMRVMPGARALIDHLKSNDYKIALATGTLYKRTQWKLEISGLAGLFDKISTGSDVTSGKPAPDIFLVAARRLKIPPEQCIGFEDSEVGLQALSAAGMRSIFVKDLIEPSPAVLATVWKRFTTLDEAIPLF